MMDSGEVDAGPIEELPPGGSISLTLQGLFYYGSGTFYDNVILEGDAVLPLQPVEGVVMDSCFPFDPFAPPEAVTGTVTLQYQDIGPSYALSGAGNTFFFEKRIDENDPTIIDYNNPESELEADWPGGPISLDILGSATVPGKSFPNLVDVDATDITTTSTNFVDALTSSFEYGWTPRSGATKITSFTLAATEDFSTILPLCGCDIADDGAFTIPQECLDVMNSPIFQGTDVGLILTFMWHRYFKDVEFNGRRVRVEVRSGVQIDHAKID